MKKKTVIKIVIAIVLIIIIVAVIRAIRKNMPAKELVDHSGFLDSLHLWVQDREGGFVVTGSGGDSALKRSPWIYNVNGHTYVNPRANKGVSYSNFLKYAPKFGYKPDKQTFGDMPIRLLGKIYDAIAVSYGLKYTNNLVLAAYLGGWIWGSGSISSTNLNKMKAILSSNLNDQRKLEEMIKVRKSHFAALHDNDPVKYPQSLVDAWDHRQDLFDEAFKNKLAA